MGNEESTFPIFKKVFNLLSDKLDIFKINAGVGFVQQEELTVLECKLEELAAFDFTAGEIAVYFSCGELLQL